MESREDKDFSRMFVTITAIYVACLVLSNLVAGKMWAVSESITLPAAVILFPVTYILGDIFTEVYGFKKASYIIWLGFFLSFFAVAVYMITIALPYPSFWENQQAYETVLGTTPRVAAASFAGYLGGEFSNSLIMSKLKIATKGEKLWARTILSTVVGEGIDSVIFITISFFGTMDNGTLLTMIVSQYLFKVIYEVVFTPVTYAAVGFVKKKEALVACD
ncbi:MAG: queuosine precursor transporter [Lachnospiraceae bacterium]|nr:queuosine precursor transporter [Lachnospiraceae bacterium]